MSTKTLDALRFNWRTPLLAEGRAAIRRAKRRHRPEDLDRDFLRDEAYDAIERAMFDHLDWERIPATEISDFAAELASEAESEVWCERL